MMRWTLSTLFLALALSGCGSVIFKEFTLEGDRPTSVSVDAKQRFLLVTKRQADKQSDRIVCAEPSPDTMVGVTASLGLDVPLSTGKVGVDSTMAQAVAQLGSRSQTIQLLRDGLYRACEAYMNGTLSEADYRTLLRHYDMTMVMLVAIDGLTRDCNKSGAIISGQGSTTPASSGTGPAATSSGSTAATAQTAQCPVSDEVAKQVQIITTAFFDYKKPLIEQVCISDMLRALSQPTAGSAPKMIQVADLKEVQHLCRATMTPVTATGTALKMQ